jgi:acyl-CoA synthetase (AMP-forming)/AMP-acid ligase II
MNVPLMDEGVEVAASITPDRDAIRAGDERWTYAQLRDALRTVAANLASRGVRPGDRVAVMLTNRLEFAPVVLGIARLGAAAVLLSPAWKHLEVGHALGLTGARLVVTESDTRPVIEATEAAGFVIDIDDEPLLRSRSGDLSVPTLPNRSASDDAVLVFSSGTTGMPKAVRHTHTSVHHAVQHWAGALGLTAEDRFQIATPPNHILGLLNLLVAFEVGATLRLHRRFDLDEMLRCIESERMTLEMAVAPIALALANHPRLEQFDLSSLRFIMWGATPVAPHVAEVVTRRTGVRWLPAYGASEVPVIAANPVAEPSRWRLDSAGLAPPGVELRVVDLETLDPLGSGVGEIEVRSPAVMAGYLPSEANDEAFHDGWYRTGDVGWIDTDGWVHLTDRVKEMIKVRGFQVAPAEIEAVLHGHPAVLDCAVFGVDDAGVGEVPVAAVVLDPDAKLRSGELEELVASSLATYKQLRRVVVVDEIPRLPSGKVLRRVLRDELGSVAG